MPEPAPLLSLVGITVRHGERVVLDNIGLTINAGERVGLLGLNGSGKTTLLRVAAGRMEPDGGEVRQRRDLLFVHMDQEPALDPACTVRAWIEGALHRVRSLEQRLHDVHERLAHAPHEEHDALLAQQADLQRLVEQHGAYDAHARVDQMAAGLSLPPGDRLLGTLSGGERRRVALCRALLEEPDLLMLDEPTNHLDAETLEWLEAHLLACRSALLFVTHDRYFLDRVATRLVEINRGAAREYNGGYEDYLEAKEAEAAAGERAEDVRRSTLRHELEWLRRQPKARTTKSKARIQGVHDLEAARPAEDSALPSFRFPDAPRLGRQALEAQHLRVERGGRLLVDDLNFILGPKDRIGIIGRNGAGKTSLVRALLGIDRPTSGRVVPGSSFTPLYSDQERDVLDPAKSVLDCVAGDVDWVRVNGERISIRAYMRRFLFDDLTMARPVALLSGGERNRVLLARLIRQGGNVAVLDEPTNDLDLQTLRVLEDAILEFDGAALLISHDRYFLERLATRILWIEGDGQVHEIAGAYHDFARYRDRVRAERAARLAAASVPAAAAPAPARQDPATAPAKKLGYHEQREFDGMEDRILAEEARLEEITGELHAPDLYARRTGEEVRALLEQKQRLEAAIEQLYARWAELGERAR